MPPRPPNPLLVQAHASFRRGDLNTAAASCEQILKARREDPGALALLAEIHVVSGRMAEALRLLRIAIRVAPDDDILRNQFAHGLLRSGDLPAAVDQFDRIVRRNENHHAARAGLASALENDGRHDRAWEHVKRWADSAQIPDELIPVLLRLMIHRGELERAVRTGAAAIPENAAPARGARSACFEMARAHEKLGDYEAAWRWATRGNLMRTAPFDVAAVRQRFEAIARAFSAEFLEAAPRPTSLLPQSEAPIFIVGVPRCGSTLTERILHAHGATHGIGEHPGIHVTAYSLHQLLGTNEIYPACAARLSAPIIDRARHVYLESIRALRPAGKRSVDKNLGNFLHLGLIALLFPEAKIIHCRRDPRDTGLSCYMEPLEPANVPYASKLEDFAAYWRLYSGHMEHWARVLTIPMLEMRYESLIEAPEAYTRRLLEFLDLPWQDACLRFHEVKRTERTLSQDQVRKPLYSTAVGRAQRFASHLAPLNDLAS